MATKLHRTEHNAIIAGVAAGLAEYFDADAVVIRIIFVFLCFAGGAGFIIYFCLWILMPSGRSKAKEIHQMEEHKDSGNGSAHDAVHATSADRSSDKDRDARYLDMRHSRHYHQGAGGFILIIIGLIILVNNVFPGYDLGRYWPVILIFIGAAILLRKRPYDR